MEEMAASRSRWRAAEALAASAAFASVAGTFSTVFSAVFGGIIVFACFGTLITTAVHIELALSISQTPLLPCLRDNDGLGPCIWAPGFTCRPRRRTAAIHERWRRSEE